MRLAPAPSLVTIGTLALGLAACGGGFGGSAAARVTVTLRDTAIEASPAEVAQGAVGFDVRNAGSTAHELEVLRVPNGADPNALPVVNHVADTAGLELVDEAEEIAPSTGATVSVTLAAGTYALICNVPGHYEAGMRTTFTVR